MLPDTIMSNEGSVMLDSLIHSFRKPAILVKTQLSTGTLFFLMLQVHYLIVQCSLGS